MSKAKKSISVILSLIMVLSLFTAVPFTAEAVTTDMVSTEILYGNYEYEVLSDGTAEITGYIGSAKIPKIPSKIGGYTVTSIGVEAFSGCTSFENVTIPSGIKSIGDLAFNGCLNLTSITIPNSVTSIGEGVFSSCASLKSINVGSGNVNFCSVDNVLFNKNKTKLIQYPSGNTETTYVIPNSVTSIGVSAFSTCISLTSVTIPSSVKSIDGLAFGGCISLNGVTIPDGVTSIGEYAFYLCMSLENITIPNSVTSIGENAFLGCESLKSITIPDGVTSIGECALGYCVDWDTLESVKMDSFTIIGYTGTEAERYAKDNGFVFVSLGEAPNEKPTEAPTEKPTEAPITAVFGDVDGDGKVTVMDATEIQRYLAEIISEDMLNLTVADVDKDGKVTILDATRIQRYKAELCNLDGSTPYIKA